MAAITPFLEQQDDPAETDLQKEAFREEAERQLRGLEGLGRVGDEDVLYTATITAEALNQSHAELLQMAWLRQVVYDSLIGRSFRVQIRDKDGANPRQVFIVLDGPIVPGHQEGETIAAWNPPATPKAEQYSLLSWTSKMAAPSFSLPAGPPGMGGSCPGATGGMSLVPRDRLLKAARKIEKVLGRPVELPKSICQHCYAEGGQYGTGGVQFAQVMRFVWAQMAVRDGTFVPTMVYSIQNANYKLDGFTNRKKKKDRKTGEEYVVERHTPAERHPGKYFRIHDSGDFFSVDYLAAWQEVARQCPDVMFWAPTRVWFAEQFSDQMRGNPPNFIVRPSAYHVNQPMPELPLAEGWAKPTVVYGVPKDKVATEQIKSDAYARGDFNWDCQTYAVEDESHTCRHAMAPDGQEGCRACWRYGDDATVNYTLH